MPQMGMGGSERLIYNLVRNLDKRVFEPSIAWLVNGLPLKEFADLGVPLYYVPKRRRFDFSTMRLLGQIVRGQGIDVVNAHHFMPFFYAYYGTKVAGRARLVYTEHSEADVLAARGRWQTIGGFLLRRADAAIGVSEKVTSTLRSHFDVRPETVHTIENGVDIEMFGSQPTQRDRLRAELGFAPRDFVIGHVANFRRNKNHVFLLRAFRDLVKQRPNARLVFIGQGAEGDAENSEPAVREFLEREGLRESVHLLGYRSNVQDLLQTLDAICLVSYKEGLPLSLIEAMASGLPVVGTDIESIRGVVQREVNGLLVPPDDDAGLTAALDRLIADEPLRKRMGKAARELAHEKYSLTRCLRQTQDLFRELVTGHGRSARDVASTPRTATPSNQHE
jgi:glycosyltransferase involved in cell wall biosynthesis